MDSTISIKIGKLDFGEWLFYIFIIYMVLMEEVVSGLVTGVERYTPFYRNSIGRFDSVEIFLLLALGLFILSSLGQKKFMFPRSKLYWSLSLWIVTLILESALTYFRGVDLVEVLSAVRRLFYFAPVAIFAFYILKSRERVKRLASIFYICVVIISLRGLLRFVGRQGLELHGTIVTYIGEENLFMGAALLILLNIIMSKLSIWVKSLALAGSSIITLMLILSIRRGAWVAFGIAVLCWIILNRRKFSKILILILLSGLLISSILFIDRSFEGSLVNLPLIQRRAMSVVQVFNQPQPGDRDRLIEVQNAILNLSHSPEQFIYGIGWGQMWQAYIGVGTQSRVFIHNFYVWLLLDGGVLALLGFLAIPIQFLVLVIRQISKLRQGFLREALVIDVSLLLGYMAYLVGEPRLVYTRGSVYFGLLLGLGMALMRMGKLELTGSEVESRGRLGPLLQLASATDVGKGGKQCE